MKSREPTPSFPPRRNYEIAPGMPEAPGVTDRP